MQNVNATQQFIAQYNDELHVLTCNCYNANMHEIVTKFVQSKSASVDINAIALHCAVAILHNYYDDGCAGGSIIEGFFSSIGYAGYNCWYAFNAAGGCTVTAVNTTAFANYATQHTAELTGINFETIKAHENK